MSNRDCLVAKMVAGASAVSPTDYTGQLAQMLAVLHDEMMSSIALSKPSAEVGQVYYRPYQLKERWGYSDAGIRRFLYSAEQSGKVRIIQPTDVNGTVGQKMYHIGDLEKLFAVKPVK